MVVFVGICLLVFLLLSFDVVHDDLIKNCQAGTFAILGALGHTGDSKINDFLEILLLADDVVELFDLKHIDDNGAGVKVVLLTLFWSEGLDEVADSHLLLLLDHAHDFWLMVSINDGQKLVKDF